MAATIDLKLDLMYNAQPSYWHSIVLYIVHIYLPFPVGIWVLPLIPYMKVSMKPFHIPRLVLDRKS